MERINQSLSALHNIAAASADSMVHRNIIWISSGFPILSRVQVSSGTQDWLFELIRKMSSELLRARMTVYTIDPRGSPSGGYSGNVARQELGTDHSRSLASVIGSSRSLGQYMQTLVAHGSLNFPEMALQTFSEETGGRSFWGRNDIDAEVAKSMTDGAHYYTLSYYPSNRNFDSKFRTIAITVNRPAVRARTRAGYFAIPDPPEPTDDQLNHEMEEALGNPVPYTGIQVRAVAEAASGDPSSRQIALTLDWRDLAWSPLPSGDQACALITATGAFTPDGKLVRIRIHKFTGNRRNPNDLAAAAQSAVLKFTVPTDSQVARLRIVVRDQATGHMGTADILQFPPTATAAKP
jgi:hypothetical protein